MITISAGGLRVIVLDRAQSSPPIHLATIDNASLWLFTGYGPNLAVSQVPQFIEVGE